MKKWLIGAALVVLVAAPALGAVNIRQLGDGTARGSGTKSGDGVCLGGGVFTWQPPSNEASDSLTGYVVTRISNALLVDYWAVNHGTIQNDTFYTFYTNGQTTTPVRWETDVNSTTTNATLKVKSAAAIGTVSTLSNTQSIAQYSGGNTFFRHNDLHKDKTIVISPTGGATTAVTLYLHVCPR